MSRLSLSSLSALSDAPSAVGLPLVDPSVVTIGIVHFGIGAFHRAHQAVYTEQAAAVEQKTTWGILGVTGRTDAVARQLRPQDCLYGVLQKGVNDTELQLIGSVRDVAWPGEDSEKVTQTIAASSTHLATLTITEKGYLRASDGTIDLQLAAVQNDIALINAELDESSGGNAAAAASRTPIGLLVRGLARRFRQNGDPFSVVSCDNIVDNGTVTRVLVESIVNALAGDGDATATQSRSGFQSWLTASVSFPSTMVDRIAPATTDADRAEAFAMLGLNDEALVVAEPFSQWVIEDNFAGPRPAWQRAGAILTNDVAPYERVKLRVLNATHSLLAWLGALRGHLTIAAAVNDPELRALAETVIARDILPTLVAPTGLVLADYSTSVLERFSNPNLAHTTKQVAMDGSQKLPMRILGTVADRLAAGETPHGLALVVASWISYIAAHTEPGAAELDDPMSSLLLQTVGSSDELRASPALVVDRVFALDAVFPATLQSSAEFRDAVVDALPIVRQLIDSA